MVLKFLEWVEQKNLASFFSIFCDFYKNVSKIFFPQKLFFRMNCCCCVTLSGQIPLGLNKILSKLTKNAQQKKPTNRSFSEMIDRFLGL